MSTLTLHISMNSRQDTGAAFAPPFIPVGILWDVLVTLRAMCLAGVHASHVRWAAQHVGSVWHQFQVRGVNTGRVIAEMVNLITPLAPLGDRPMPQGIGVPVRRNGVVPLAEVEGAVAIGLSTSPYPAGSRFVYLGPEPLLVTCIGDPATEGAPMTEESMVVGVTEPSAGTDPSASKNRAYVPHEQSLPELQGNYNVRKVS